MSPVEKGQSHYTGKYAQACKHKACVIAPGDGNRKWENLAELSSYGYDYSGVCPYEWYG